MARCGKHHLELDENGKGFCSVPMWSGGLPAGFCDKEAYGEQLPCPTYRDIWTGEICRTDGKRAGYIPGLACPMHGGPEQPTTTDKGE